MLNGLDLFSGIGGLTLALSEWVKPVSYCESDRYAQGVLLSRMRNWQLPVAPIWDDVRTLSGQDVPGQVDILYGGFPCQDLSAAGAGRGLAGERSGLFFEIERLVRETNPRFVFLENVPAIRTRGLNAVVQSFTELRYDCRWTIVSAAEVGAPHLRKRWFLLAHANGERSGDESGWRSGTSRKSSPKFIDNGAEESLADSASIAKRKQANEADAESTSRQTWDEPFDRSWWATEPDVGRVACWVPHRMDRLKALGNAVVPAQAREAFKRLTGLP